MSLGLFPRQVPTSEGESGRGVGWLESEIAEWQAQRIAERDRRDGGDA
jgi:predicted DNA-binding transcriptional regulator AlpA